MIKIKRMSSDALHSKVQNMEKMGEASHVSWSLSITITMSELQVNKD